MSDEPGQGVSEDEAPAQPADTAPPDVRWTPPVGVQRRPLVPRWVPFAIAGVVAVALIAAGLIWWRSEATRVRVPSLEGLDPAAATTRLQELGLRLAVGDRRFSASVPPGIIMDQTPRPGTIVTEGSAVEVAISAGSESFAMPDVIGLLVDRAKQVLRDRGLGSEITAQPSDRPQGTVLESFPSPGVTVMTGDTVRLTVASGNTTTGTLLPVKLDGKVFVLDPAPVPAGATDVTMDVARRVRALLEASGARVVVTRQITDSGDAVSTVSRARKAKETSSTALVGFSVAQSGPGGLAIQSVPATTATEPFYIGSLTLATAVADALKADFGTVASAPATNDAILTGTGVPAVRLRLGNTGLAADRLTFTDPVWADKVARDVYSALGSAYGTR